MKSRLFTSSVGVFEGGGVRGAAFAGAYRAASEAGITFQGTVGTSSGSIAAALIAAGLSPEGVEKALRVDFKSFLREPAQAPSIMGRVAVATARRLGRIPKWLAYSQFALGLYSSRPIETWLNGILRQHLKSDDEIVRFRHLPKPLVVIAADMTSRGRRMWSRANTPDVSVAFAVRASCTIPFFFQPVTGDASFLIDGGVLANLPMFGVAGLELEPDVPVLCFRLVREREPETPSPSTGFEMSRALLDTVVNGMAEVQLSMARHHQIIKIPTGRIDATDFDISKEEIEELVANGVKATQEFIKDELSHPGPERGSVRGLLRGYREGLLEETAELIRSIQRDIWILGGDLSWFGEVNAFMLIAAFQGRQIRVLCEQHDGQDYKDALAAVLALGAEVREVASRLFIQGTIVDAKGEFSEMVCIEGEPETHGRRYKGSDDPGMLGLAAEYFEKCWKAGSAKGSPQPPSIMPIPEQDLLRSLATVPQYRSLRMSMETVEIKGLKPLPRYLEKLKLARAAALANFLADRSIQTAARVVGSPWPITPPIIERLRNGDLIVIDGAHRVYHAISENRRELRVAVVENDGSQPLPATPFPDWKHVRVVSEKKRPEDRWQGYRRDDFRKIRAAFRELARSM